jgi:two-component system response regulator AtoC
MERSLNILLADDEEIVHQTIAGYLRDLGHQVDSVYDGLAALESIRTGDYDIAIVDIRMPGMGGIALLAKMQEVRPDISVAIITGQGSMETAIQAMRLGAVDFLRKPPELLLLDAMLERLALVHGLRRDKRRLRETIGGIQASVSLREGSRNFVGTSSAAHKVREQIQRAVEADCETILITGETGTGKEVVSRAIHFQASSDESPFIAVSCPALPDSLVESELFGHAKGAFTGAITAKTGSFELADGGTLFLDEVADLSAPAQAKLLRVLETRTLRRVGGSKEIHVDVRVISATNAPLEKLVETRNFRADLFYRLNVYSIHILPLRERREDILPLAEHFLSNYAAPRNLQFDGFSPEAMDALLSYDFPGNARELRNLIERAAILCRSAQIQAKHLNLSASSHAEPPYSPAKSDQNRERARILEALEEAKWNRRQAAKALDMPYSTLRYKMQRLGIA